MDHKRKTGGSANIVEVFVRVQLEKKDIKKERMQCRDFPIFMFS